MNMDLYSITLRLRGETSIYEIEATIDDVIKKFIHDSIYFQRELSHDEWASFLRMYDAKFICTCVPDEVQDSECKYGTRVIHDSKCYCREESLWSKLEEIWADEQSTNIPFSCVVLLLGRLQEEFLFSITNTRTNKEYRVESEDSRVKFTEIWD